MYRDDPFEQIRYIALTTLPGVDVLSVTRSTQPWHVFHERYAFCGCRQAAAGWHYRGKEHLSVDGSSMLLEPGETHSNTEVNKPSEFRVVFVPSQDLELAAQELGLSGAPHFNLASTEDPGVFSSIYTLSTSVYAGESALAHQSAFVCLVRRVLEYCEKQPVPPEVHGCRTAVNIIKRYIADRYDQALTLDELSAVSGMSRFRLIRAFARFEGLTPHAYLIHVRISRSLMHLRKGLSPIEVASMLGFADQSHFNRHFRNIMKVTPGQYARSIRTRE